MNNFNNNFNEKPLYPNEAYSEIKQEEGPDMSKLLPLLMASMQNNGDNNELLSSLLNTSSDNNNSKLIQTLASSFLNKSSKKKEKISTSVEEKPFPKNDYLF